MHKIMFHLNCLELGGAERVVTNLANQFATENYEVVVATQWQGEQEFTLEKQVRRIHVGLRPEDEGKNRFTKILLRMKYLQDLIEQEQPDVVIAFAHNAIYRTLLAVKKNKIPTVIAVRNNPVGNYDKPIDKILIPLLYGRADGSVFQTEAQRDYFLKYIKPNATVILNPISDKYIHAPKVETKTKTIVHSGRIKDFKNQAMLIRAFSKVHEKHPDYDLKIYGGDSHDGTWEELLQIILKHNLRPYVSLMGQCDNLEQELPKGEVCAFSSNYEGLPNAMLEAMALGLPVVATDCPPGGPRSVITHGENGLLIPVGDEQALADSINQLIENPELAAKLGENARKISERANIQTIHEQWKAYLEQVIQEATLQA